jgi:UDP-glucose 4-epimerase
MSNVLITGGTGFVGGRIASSLSASHTVVLSSRKNPDSKMLQAHGAAKGIIHQQLLDSTTFPDDVDTVIHMAALNEWDCVSNPSEAIRVNIDETRIILENAIKHGVKEFIYFSTAHAYGQLTGHVTEKRLPVPVHPYAITHRAAEDYVNAAGIQKKISTVCLRLSNSFGAPVVPSVNRWTLLANDLAKQAIEKKQLTLLSNGCQYRDFICLSDVTAVVSEMISNGISNLKHPMYNLGSGQSMRVLDMANLISSVYKELYNQDLPIIFPEAAVQTTEPGLQFDISLLESAGFKMKNDFKAEIKNLLQFCREHFSKIE